MRKNKNKLLYDFDHYKNKDKGSNNVFSIIYSHKSKKVPIFTTSIFYYSPLNVKIMASRRELKKNVNYIAGELFTECLINSMFIPGTDKDKADELMSEVLKMQDEFVTRISHTEPGNVKVFYKKFRADFNAKVNEIIEAIGKLN